MDKVQLHQKLELLHKELQGVDSPDPKDREILRSLAEDIRRILELEETDSERYQGLPDRLKDGISRVEASHPQATMRMRQILDQIAFLGI